MSTFIADTVIYIYYTYRYVCRVRKSSKIWEVEFSLSWTSSFVDHLEKEKVIIYGDH